MNHHRRDLLRTTLAASAGAALRPLAVGALGAVSARAGAEQTLRIAHQFPASSGETGDFRDRLCRRFAAEVEKRTGGALKATVYAGGSMMKTEAQFRAMSKGALDMSLVPLSYAGGEVPETNIGLVPGVVTSYEQGSAWKSGEAGRSLAGTLADKGVVIVSWIWQAGGVASRGKAIVEPQDAAGLKIRGGSREMNVVLKQVGASVVSLPSDEIYAAMQTGALDAAMTSSTSLISYRLEELAHHLTAGRGKTYWFMLEPLMISRSVLESLPKDQQQVILAVGAELELMAVEAARADDRAVADVYLRAGREVHDMSEATVQRWQALARDTAWKDFASRSDGCARLMKLAEKSV
jgi:TRAP-type C4-dicarboxylate transport system substrate-binding protein